jgi:hypothetical protein
MNPIQPREDLTREEIVSLCLRQCALVIDPRNGHLKSLAAEFEWHEITVYQWIKNGRIPFKSARRLQRRFGKKLVNIELLVAK